MDSLASGTTTIINEYEKMITRTIMKGMFVQNHFLQGVAIENAKKLKIYMKLVNKNMMLV